MRQPVTIIVPPASTLVVSGVSHTSSPRAFHEVDRFRDQFAQAAGFEVPIIESSLEQVPEKGFLFVYEDCSHDRFPSLGPRIVLMNAHRSEMWSGRRESLVTDAYQLAAAIEETSYFHWQTGPDGPGGIHGLMSVAKQAGMSVGSLRSPVSDYGVLSCHDHCHSMAEVLVHYLTVYEEMGVLRDPA